MLCGYNDILLYDHETDRRLRLHPILDSHGADVPIFNNTVHLLPELSCLLLEKRPSLENGFGGGTGLWTVLSHATPPLPSMDQPIQLDGTYQWPTLPIQPHVELFQTSRHSIYHFLESDAASTTSLPRAPASTRLYFAPRPATNGRTMNTYASSPVLPLSFLDLPDDAGLKWTASGLPVAVSCNSRSPSISLKFSPITGLAAANYCASLKIPQLFQHSWSLDVFDEVHGIAVATTATQVFVIQF
ncbi:hypothetical protein SISNIDRAFT_134185 [Sistotremastrum niveocremeum HHB9708]|uniref:Uncharacterized protein n=1 Tax=Sistotremastrum niveocremeum HHB9708 TaxID=1314777 RepID=A0A164ZWN2_9AGAM|nr:hypothetical protein SISNIDRAFT_134185 [Sistotremastrum niveocremeum HHB9708]